MTNYMNMPDFQKSDEINEKDKSASTSSFYRNAPKHKSTLKNHTFLGNTVDFQQRETSEGIEKLKLTLNIKREYIQKRGEESNEENNKIINQLMQTEKQLTDKLKQIQKNDKTKQWFLQMQQTIQGILEGTKVGEKKAQIKYLQKCKTIQQKLNESQQKIREQRKQRQKQWEQVIDNVGGTIIQAQQLIGIEREQMQQKLLQLQKNIFDVDEEVGTAVQDEKKARKQQHQYLSKLIERIMDKLLSC